MASQTDARKRVAVIGAGASGLTAIKCCLDEGLEPVCYERTDYIGGLWHYTPDSVEGQACVMKSTVINTSKEMMCYSDYPIPKEFAVYMHNRRVDQYFHMYADHFKLKQYINFNIEVNSVKQTADFSTTGQWEITITNKKSGAADTQVFDAVLVCTGHHADVNWPVFPGMDQFKGKLTHSHDYKTFSGYEDKRVVVVGIGNSGGDIVVELSRVASKVYLSTRRGSWIINRISDYGKPLDMHVTTRFNAYIREMFPNAIIRLAKQRLHKRFDHKKYSLEPNHPPTAQHPTINDDLPNRIASGGVIVKPNIRRFTATGVEFDDGTMVEADAVVFATGYIFGFPFLDKSVVDVKDNRVNLFKYMFPPDLDHSTLAVIGCFQPLGAIMPLSEMQCRLATRVFKGDTKLPSRTDMWANIRSKAEMMSKRYVTSQRHTIQVDYSPYMDELAEFVGCKPDLGKLFMTDPRLALEVTFGPASPYQYRLMGPGKWGGARDAIMTQWDRTYYSLGTRKCDVPSSDSWKFVYVMFVVIAIFWYFIA